MNTHDQAQKAYQALTKTFPTCSPAITMASPNGARVAAFTLLNAD
jgi:hypothetical protein